MRALTIRSIAVLVLSLFVAGCGVGVTETDDELGDEGEELSPSKPSFVRLRDDTRRCMAPLCGGYWVRDVNSRSTRETYVAGLDFSLSGLDPSTVAKIEQAPSSDIVLKAKLGPIERTHHTRPLMVLEAYRGLPGVTAAGDIVYSVAERSPAIRCITAPCNNELASKLNSTITRDFTRVSVQKISKPYLDQAWVYDRVVEHGALVAGAFVNGTVYPGGPEKVLEAHQVFVKLPDVVGPCSKKPEPACENGAVPSYSRDANRCITFSACVKPGYCAMFVAHCEDGYTLTSWSVEPSGCPAYACEPSFVAE